MHRPAFRGVHHGRNFGSAGMELDVRSVLQEEFLVRQETQFAVEPVLGRIEPGQGDGITAADGALFPMATLSARTGRP